MNFRDRSHCAWIALILALLLTGSVSDSLAQSQDSVLSAGRPLLEVDLRSYGYKSHVRGTRDYWSIAFVANDDLVLGWTTFDGSDAGKKTGYLTAAPSHLHAVVLNARTGQKKLVRDWAVSTFYANIHPVAKDDFLICTGNAISILSQDFNLIRELALPRFGPCTANEVSPSGRFFSIDSGSGKQFQRSVMKTESLTPVTTWSNDARNVHFSDSSLVGNCAPIGELCVRKFESSWAPFTLSGVDRLTSVLCFVDDSELVLRTRNGLAVVTADGNPVFQVNLESKKSIGETTCSSGGQRFAAVQMRMRGVTNEVLDMHAFPSDDEVVVYDLLEHNAIYMRKIKGTSPWPPFAEHRNRIAISSDGALLAVLDDGILSVYELPVPKS